MFLAACAWLVAANIAAYAAFALDKRAAIRGDWRVRESTLLTIVAAGGAFGAVLAQTLLRHKTRKEPFRTQLYVIIGVELVLLGAVSLPLVRLAVTDLLAASAAPEPDYPGPPYDGPNDDLGEF
jgi:uncharacterized membrane protein YsdA (DUF1294 family)